MYTVPSFVPKVIEYTPGCCTVFQHMEDYLQNRTTKNIASREHVKCLVCKATFPSAEAAENNPVTYLCNEIDFNITRQEGEGGYFRRYRCVERVCSHEHLLMVARVETELGDAVVIPKQQPRTVDKQAYWLGAYHSPLNRGVLPHERIGREWLKRYPHLDPVIAHRWYRCLKTHQERKAYSACTIEPDAPTIRGKRKPAMLPTSWDDKAICRQRGWKTKKVKKQWMVNLG